MVPCRGLVGVEHGRRRQAGLHGDERAADMDGGERQPRREAEQQADQHLGRQQARERPAARAAAPASLPASAGLSRTLKSSASSRRRRASTWCSPKPGHSISAAPNRANTRSTAVALAGEQVSQHGRAGAGARHQAPMPAMRPNRPRVKSPRRSARRAGSGAGPAGSRPAWARRTAWSPGSGSAPAGARSARPRPAPPAALGAPTCSITQTVSAAELDHGLGRHRRSRCGQIGIRMISW